MGAGWSGIGAKCGQSWLQGAAVPQGLDCWDGAVMAWSRVRGSSSLSLVSPGCAAGRTCCISLHCSGTRGGVEYQYLSSCLAPSRGTAIGRA